MSCVCDKCPNCVTCPNLKKNIVLSTFRNITPETRKVLSKMDALTLTALKVLPPDLIKKNKDPVWTNDEIDTKEVDLGWKKSGRAFDSWERENDVRLIKEVVSPNFITYKLSDDDFFGKNTGLSALVNRGMSSTCLFPMIDKMVLFASEEEAMQLCKDTGLVQGKALPPSYNKNFDMLSDESFSRIFFQSLGAPLVAAQKPNDPAIRQDLGPFVVDMPLQSLKVRPGFRPYGARIHFNEDQVVTAIFDYYKERLYKPSDGEEWDAAKLVAKITAFTLVTAREHLTWAHLVISNTITNFKTIFLPPSHPLRRLLTVFTFRTSFINSAAFGTLTNESGLLHRSLGLEYESMQEVFDMSFAQCLAYKPFPEHKLAPEVQKLVDEGKFPYISDGLAYYNIVEKFVNSWFAAAGGTMTDGFAMRFYNKVKDSTHGMAYVVPEYSSEKDMINLVTQFIFMVTAYHELVGGVTDYVQLPTRAGFRVLEDYNGDQIDIQSFIGSTLIGASTSIRMPMLMKEFKNFFGAGGAPAYEREVWNMFLIDLQEQSKKVQAANATRAIAFHSFDPAVLECSISV